MSVLGNYSFELDTHANNPLVVQTIGGAFLVSAGESAFEAVLTKKLRASDPSVNSMEVIGTGATDVRAVFSPTDIPFILRAYVSGIQTAFIVAIALASTCTVIAFGAKWQKLRPAPMPRLAGGAETNTGTTETKDKV